MYVILPSDPGLFQKESDAKSFLGLSRQKRRTGQIVHECCDNICSWSIVESYCNPWPEEATTTTTTTTQPPTEPPTDGKYLTDETRMEDSPSLEFRGLTDERREDSPSDMSEENYYPDALVDESPMPTERGGVSAGGRSPHIRQDKSADVEHDEKYHEFSEPGTAVDESDGIVENPLYDASNGRRTQGDGDSTSSKSGDR